jgi:PAS domain S-box-containing protein/putative nucleotidyltransferase with HDIG domain
MIGMASAIAEGVKKFSYEDVKFPYPDEAKPRFFLNTWTVAKGFEKNYSHVYLTMLDVTGIKASQLQAVESERQYRMLLENAQEGILGVDAEARFTFANPQLENMLGYPEKELVGRCFFDLIVPSDSEAARQSFEQGKQGHADKIELRFLNRDGASIPTLIKANPVFDGDGKFVAGVGLVDDLRRIKSIEDELREQTKRLGTVWHQTIAAIAYAVESRDPYTAGHQRRVQQLAMVIAKEMDLSEQELSGLKIAALVHDIGKISIPSEILSKPGHLNPLEYQLITSHSKAGYDILRPIEFPWPIAEIVYQHHEAMDGSGYPRGLKGEEILLEARILAVADMVEAVSSHRPYRAALGTEYALQELNKARGLKYDTEVVEACVHVFSKGFAWEEEG